MACIKFSFLLFMALTSAWAQVAEAPLAPQSKTRFSPKACLDSGYKMSMVKKGALFGLMKHAFVINKSGCIINITHRKYLPKEWIIDVCREPVHIKVTSATGVDVAKKENDCVKNDKSRDTSDFCSQYFDLIDVIQDEGLIFATGDRDDLESDHGKTYCAYLLLKNYLVQGKVFSRYTDVPDIFLEPKTVAPAPMETGTR